MSALLSILAVLLAAVIMLMMCDLPVRRYYWKHLGFGVYAKRFHSNSGWVPRWVASYVYDTPSLLWGPFVLRWSRTKLY